MPEYTSSDIRNITLIGHGGSGKTSIAEALLKEPGLNVETGRFRQHMMVELVNDGPVTIMLDSADREQPRRG